MSFADQRLVAFGDSYTFGQGLYPFEGEFKNWKQKCNDISYINLVSQQLGFGEHINMSYPGASNAGIMSMIKSFYSKNKNAENDLYVISLTLADRDEISSLAETTNRQNVFDFTYTGWEHARSLIKSKDKNVDAYGYNLDCFTKISENTMKVMLSYYYNKHTMLLKHIHTFNSIVDFLNARNIKFVLLDGINDAPSLQKRYDILKTFDWNNWRQFYKEHNYIDKSIVEIYYEDLENNEIPQYLNYYNFKHYKEFVGTGKINPKKVYKCMDDYVLKYGKEHHGSSDYVTIPDDGHWNQEGHLVASYLVSDWIKRHHV